jgi:glucosylceramidase
MEEKPAIRFGVERAAQLTITVDDALRYRTIEGFGASLTDSSAWLLKNTLTESQRKETLQKLFDPKQGSRFEPSAATRGLERFRAG